MSARNMRHLIVTCVTLATLAFIAYATLAATDRASDGSAKFVLLPLGIGALLAVAGGVRLRAVTVPPPARRCGTCDYDLRAHAPGGTLPECGTEPGTTSTLRIRDTLTAHWAGLGLVALGCVFVVIGLFYLSLWRSGALGAV